MNQLVQRREECLSTAIIQQQEVQREVETSGETRRTLPEASLPAPSLLDWLTSIRDVSEFSGLLRNTLLISNNDGNDEIVDLV